MLRVAERSSLRRYAACVFVFSCCCFSPSHPWSCTLLLCSIFYFTLPRFIKEGEKRKSCQVGHTSVWEAITRKESVFFFFLSLCVCVCVCVKQSRYFENPWQTTRRATLCQLTALRRTHSVSSYLLPLLLLFLFALITTSYIYIYTYSHSHTWWGAHDSRAFFFFPYTRQWRMWLHTPSILDYSSPGRNCFESHILLLPSFRLLNNSNKWLSRDGCVVIL